MTDHTPLTDQQLTEIEARATSEHLTPGPWTLDRESCDCSDGYCHHGMYVTGVVTPAPTEIAAERCKRTGEQPRDYDFHRSEIGDFPEADWELMAHARTDVPLLVAEVRRLRTELAAFEMLAPQQCPAGKHADWLVDSEYAHTCPWCAIEESRLSLSEALHLGNGAPWDAILDRAGELSRRDVEARQSETPPGADTLPTWLYSRFIDALDAPAWDRLTDDDRAYWAHQAAAVRRAVARGGCKTGEPRPAVPAAGVTGEGAS